LGFKRAAECHGDTSAAYWWSCGESDSDARLAHWLFTSSIPLPAPYKAGFPRQMDYFFLRLTECFTFTDFPLTFSGVLPGEACATDLPGCVLEGMLWTALIQRFFAAEDLKFRAFFAIFVNLSPVLISN